MKSSTAGNNGSKLGAYFRCVGLCFDGVAYHWKMRAEGWGEAFKIRHWLGGDGEEVVYIYDGKEVGLGSEGYERVSNMISDIPNGGYLHVLKRCDAFHSSREWVSAFEGDIKRYPFDFDALIDVCVRESIAVRFGNKKMQEHKPDVVLIGKVLAESESIDMFGPCVLDIEVIRVKKGDEVRKNLKVNVHGINRIMPPKRIGVVFKISLIKAEVGEGYDLYSAEEIR